MRVCQFRHTLFLISTAPYRTLHPAVRIADAIDTNMFALSIVILSALFPVISTERSGWRDLMRPHDCARGDKWGMFKIPPT